MVGQFFAAAPGLKTSKAGEMDTTRSVVTGALLRSGSADPLGDILVYLERARGYVSGSPIDYCMPCTASEDAVFQILASAPLWNEVLCWLDLELRKLPGVGTQLELVHIRNVCHTRPTPDLLRHSTTLVHWLLKTHRCVVSVHIPYIRDIIMKCILDHIELDDLLWKNDSVKVFSINISFLSRVTEEPFCKAILSMKRLEELHWKEPTCTATLSNTISALLVASKTLTVLDFETLHITKAQAQTLLNALRANYTLQSLTLSSSVVTAAPSMFVTFLSDTLALAQLRVAGATERDALTPIFRGMIANGTVSSLDLDQLFLYEHSAILGARMLAHNRVLRSIRLLRYDPLIRFLTYQVRSAEVFKKTASWLDALVKNDTLQYTTLSVNIWADECWEQFFSLLSRNDNLKEVTIVAGESERSRLADIAKKVEEVGCEEKSPL
ncbi:hypothetical protein HPB51_009697 [Rhipicephalus microplus]|uniref:Uncharacterized protein n=1 Tax=Rhipicephalus microplus TaxID=6941 RepID=A0A9J6ESB4_RHIMP|nr:hypothetical protein HPB51_009697 [Rhipicephalus microplus]